MNIYIHANCQGQALKRIIETSLDARIHNVTIYKPVHLLKMNDCVPFYNALNNSDIIIMQSIGTAFGEFCSSSHISEKYSSKDIIVIPNLYFDGYFPDLRYLRGLKEANSFSEYHSQNILDAYTKGASVSEAVSGMLSVGELKEDFSASSIERLVDREEACTLVMSDYISDNFDKRRLFWTFNHPANEVLVEMASRIMKLIGKVYRNRMFGKELLGTTVFPISASSREYYNLKFDFHISVKGISYDIASFVSNYYRVYDLESKEKIIFKL